MRERKIGSSGRSPVAFGAFGLLAAASLIVALPPLVAGRFWAPELWAAFAGLAAASVIPGTRWWMGPLRVIAYGVAAAIWYAVINPGFSDYQWLVLVPTYPTEAVTMVLVSLFGVLGAFVLLRRRGHRGSRYGVSVFALATLALLGAQQVTYARTLTAHERYVVLASVR